MRSVGRLLGVVTLALALPVGSGCHSSLWPSPAHSVPLHEGSAPTLDASQVPEATPPESAPRWASSSPEEFAGRVHPLPPCPMPVSERLRQEAANLWTDHKNYYAWATLRDLALGIGGAGILANTSMDQEFRDWYQNDVRSGGLDKFADVVKPFGDGRIIIPGCFAAAVVGAFHDDTRWGSGLAEFGARTGRAYAVGVPPLVFMQHLTGGSRPWEGRDGSYWRPFDDSHGASGHAFIGAVPFITGAQMTDDPYLKGCLYFCSLIPAWSRIEDDMHYVSQVGLGWWMAYLACAAVNKTQHEDDRLLVSPVTTPEMAGVAVMYRY